jgi:thymidylate synthase ThyX
VSSQRNDRQDKYDRDEAPQSALVNMKFTVNAQAVMDISRKRLCQKASKETREAWLEFVNSLQEEMPELRRLCVPNCIYRNGICSEFEPCGYNKTNIFENKRKEYLKIYGE